MKRKGYHLRGGVQSIGTPRVTLISESLFKDLTSSYKKVSDKRKRRSREGGARRKENPYQEMLPLLRPG
jgi:hypothetical protein